MIGEAEVILKEGDTPEYFRMDVSKMERETLYE